MNIDDRMFDFKEFYNRMAEELPNNCIIAEVGVADGASSLYLADRLRKSGKKFKLYMIDNLDYGKASQLNTIVKNVIAYSPDDSIEIMATDSLNASCKFNDGFFNMVFVDASHLYEETKADIRLWFRKVKDGGILAGHDYNEEEGNHVKLAVSEVLPQEITRDTLYSSTGELEQTFEPETFLHIENTERGLGVWWVKKDFYKKTN